MLFARTWGQGPLVVLLHGLGASSRYWEALAEASSGYAAVLLGFGRSPKPPHASYHLACHLEALAPLLPSCPVVVGHFTAAVVAAAFAAARPRGVRALLLLGLPAFSRRCHRPPAGRPPRPSGASPWLGETATRRADGEKGHLRPRRCWSIAHDGTRRTRPGAGGGRRRRGTRRRPVRRSGRSPRHARRPGRGRILRQRPHGCAAGGSGAGRSGASGRATRAEFAANFPTR